MGASVSNIWRLLPDTLAQGFSSLLTRKEINRMSDAINSVFQNFANFQGRATRSHNSILGTFVSLAFIIPTIAVGTRRMHDVGRVAGGFSFPSSISTS
jgi:hypothetical protein